MVHGARRQAGLPVFGRAATRIDRERDGARRYAGLVHGHGRLDHYHSMSAFGPCSGAMILGFAELAVIPLPWIAPIFIRWFVERIQLAGGWRVGFVGRAEDIWWVFIVYALCAVAGVAYSPLQLLAIPLQAFLVLLIVGWFFANLTWEAQAEQ